MAENFRYDLPGKIFKRSELATAIREMADVLADDGADWTGDHYGRLRMLSSLANEHAFQRSETLRNTSGVISRMQFDAMSPDGKAAYMKSGGVVVD